MNYNWINCATEIMQPWYCFRSGKLNKSASKTPQKATASFHLNNTWKKSFLYITVRELANEWKGRHLHIFAWRLQNLASELLCSWATNLKFIYQKCHLHSIPIFLEIQLYFVDFNFLTPPNHRKISKKHNEDRLVKKLTPMGHIKKDFWGYTRYFI